MLVLTRKTGESIMIGENIQVTILGQNGNQVRVGVLAPAEISIDREEIRARKEQGLEPKHKKS